MILGGIPYGRKYWRGVKFGDLAVSNCQFFIRRIFEPNLNGVIS